MSFGESKKWALKAGALPKIWKCSHCRSCSSGRAERRGEGARGSTVFSSYLCTCTHSCTPEPGLWLVFFFFFLFDFSRFLNSDWISIATTTITETHWNCILGCSRILASPEYVGQRWSKWLQPNPWMSQLYLSSSKGAYDWPGPLPLAELREMLVIFSVAILNWWR